jgi:hypothetical protein
VTSREWRDGRETASWRRGGEVRVHGRSRAGLMVEQGASRTINLDLRPASVRKFREFPDFRAIFAATHCPIREVATCAGAPAARGNTGGQLRRSTLP